MTAGPLRSKPVALHDRSHRLAWLSGATVLLVAAALLGLLAGPVDIAVGAIVRDLAARLPAIGQLVGGEALPARESVIVWELRLPRIVTAALVGGMLAVAGTVYQAVFRNPLADPYLLGVAAGAGLGATLAIAARGPVGGVLSTVPAGAFAGALLAVSLTYVLGASGGRSRATLVLAGIAVGSFLAALQTYLLSRDDETLRQAYSWMLGRLSYASWDQAQLALPYVVVSLAVIFTHRRHLDLFALSDDEIRSLGVDVRSVRLRLVAAATLGTAAVVSIAGLIGFVGIIVPHAVRLLTTSMHRTLVPLSLLGGAAFLMIADLAARTAAAPAEVPVGVVTALCGAPFFIAIMRMSRRSGGLS